MNVSAPSASRLGQLRAQLDALDDQIHDLLMQRARIVESVATEGGKKGTKIRPGREAVILRRLLARHEGALPQQAIIRLWREIFGAALIIEGGQTMAVCDGEGGETRLALAREHFGPLTPVRRHHNPSQTLADLAREGGAQLAILPPLAEDDEAHGGWWPLLTATGQS
ncbi:MAG: chorismate mutase, partial [Acidocella sp.]|nr:chorismate mutase [Acidocella sp.]